MASVYDVAKYFLEKNGTLTTMKLHKLCYYAQAWSLAWDELPMFEEDFEAWTNGPVCPDLFQQHKGRFQLTKGELGNYSPEVFTKDQMETLDEVQRFYGNKSPAWLSDLTHNELPWMEARGTCPAGQPCKTKISRETMQQFYAGL